MILPQALHLRVHVVSTTQSGCVRPRHPGTRAWWAISAALPCVACARKSGEFGTPPRSDAPLRKLCQIVAQVATPLFGCWNEFVFLIRYLIIMYIHCHSDNLRFGARSILGFLLALRGVVSSSTNS